MLNFPEFRSLVKNAPLISIDLIVYNNDSEVLLGRRLNAPAKDFFFVPGGRILKNERIDAAFRRLSLAELGVAVDFSMAKMLGVYEHFYDDSFVGDDTSTHYVVLAYELNLNVELDSLPKFQHGSYSYLSRNELLDSSNVHFYTKQYFVQKV